MTIIQVEFANALAFDAQTKPDAFCTYATAALNLTSCAILPTPYGILPSPMRPLEMFGVRVNVTAYAINPLFTNNATVALNSALAPWFTLQGTSSVVDILRVQDKTVDLDHGLIWMYWIITWATILWLYNLKIK